MHQLITKIGKGQRGAKDLSWGEAKQAAQDLIEGNATPYQAGAFLMAMRIKLEGVTELASFTAATRSYVPQSPLRPASTWSTCRCMPKSTIRSTCAFPQPSSPHPPGRPSCSTAWTIPRRPPTFPGYWSNWASPPRCKGKTCLQTCNGTDSRTWTSRCITPPWQSYWRCASNWEPKTCSIRSPGCSIPRERTRKWWAWPIRRISKRSRKR